MKLYFSKGACSLTVRIILNELNIPCEYIAVDLRSKKTENGLDFLAINAKGAVPTLEVRDEIVITENAVILQYLADTNKAFSLLPAVGDFYRYRVLEWLNYITTELHKGCGVLFNPTLSEEVKQSVFIPLLKKKLAYVNDELAEKDYLMGDEFTLPDAYLFVVMRWVLFFKIDSSEWSNLMRYFKTLASRPSVKKSLEQEGLA